MLMQFDKYQWKITFKEIILIPINKTNYIIPFYFSYYFYFILVFLYEQFFIPYFKIVIKNIKSSFLNFFLIWIIKKLAPQNII